MEKLATLGIDPGISGGLAALLLEKNTLVKEARVIPMPTKPGLKGKRRDVDGRAVAMWLNAIKKEGWTFKLACIELVGSMPKQGVTSMFNFGKSTGKVMGIVEGMKIPLIEPKPQDWHKQIFSRVPKGRQNVKTAALRWAHQYFPNVDIKFGPKGEPHDGVADALCLAEYARQRMYIVDTEEKAARKREEAQSYHHFV